MTITEKSLTETARFLFEQKIRCVNTVANVCMSWYVSTVVFYGTILGVVWWNRRDLTNSKAIFWLGWILTFFFAGVLYYGITFIKYLKQLDRQISDFTKEVGYEGFFAHEMFTFKRAMWIGTLSFSLILLAWLVLWGGLWLGSWS